MSSDSAVVGLLRAAEGSGEGPLPPSMNLFSSGVGRLEALSSGYRSGILTLRVL